MKRIPKNPNISALPIKEGGQRQLLMYVEDDEDNRLVASLRLENRYELLFASTDREACETLLKHFDKLDLILMDIELRGSSLNGIDLTRLFRGKLNSERIPSYATSIPKLEIPIIFVTAYGELYRPELLAAGGDEIIEKPVNFVELQTAIARAYLQRSA